MKRASCGFWLTERGMLHLKHTCYKTGLLKCTCFTNIILLHSPVLLLSLWNEEVEETITFKARLFWFMAHRTRNSTVEAFFWYLFELLYGLYSLYVKELMVSISACMLF